MNPIIEAMSIHTVEIKIQTNKKSFQHIYNLCEKEYKLYRKYNKKSNYIKYMSTKNNFIPGVNSIMLRLYENDYGQIFSEVNIVFNLNTILPGAEKSDPFLTIIPPELIPEAMVRVWRFVEELNIYNCTTMITRIDLSINLEFNSLNEAEAFIYICSKAKWHDYLYDVVYYDKISKRKKPLKDCILKYCHQYEIAIYSKNKQMKSSNKGYDEDELRRAEKVVRMEKRINRNYILYLLKKYECSEEDLLIEHFQSVVRFHGEQQLKLMQRTLGTGHFYSYSNCIDRIDRLDITDYSKSKIKSIIESASKHKSFYWLYSENSPYKEYDVRSVKKYLKDRGISHLTIPDKFNISVLVNPFTESEDDAEKYIYAWNEAIRTELQVG